MKRLLFIYGILIPIITITAIISKAMLIFWFIIAGISAVFHDLIFTTPTMRGETNG